MSKLLVVKSLPVGDDEDSEVVSALIFELSSSLRGPKSRKEATYLFLTNHTNHCASIISQFTDSSIREGKACLFVQVSLSFVRNVYLCSFSFY